MSDAPGMKPVPESTVEAGSAAGEPSKARRRLLFAAGAALPSICTLGSGAAIAATSNIVCLTRQGPPPVRFKQDDDYVRWPDGWVRSPVNVGEYDGTPADCITTPQSSCADSLSSPAPAAAAAPPGAPAAAAGGAPAAAGGGAPVANAQDGSVWIVQGNRVISSPRVPITNVSFGHKHYGLVYVDQTGSVTTLDPNGAPNLVPVTTSCWASMMGGTNGGKLG